MVVCDGSNVKKDNYRRNAVLTVSHSYLKMCKCCVGVILLKEHLSVVCLNCWRLHSLTVGVWCGSSAFKAIWFESLNTISWLKNSKIRLWLKATRIVLCHVQRRSKSNYSWKQLFKLTSQLLYCQHRFPPSFVEMNWRTSNLEYTTVHLALSRNSSSKLYYHYK